MTILTGAGVEKLTPSAKGVSAGIKTSDGKSASHDFSHATVAVGILPHTENIGLEQLGVKSTKGHIDTDPSRRTNVEGGWATGDATVTPEPTHKPTLAGGGAAEAVAGGKAAPHRDQG